jgi:multiple sugar transport system permease protein
VFALPFVWLVATSVKWDREVFAETPNWVRRLIPRFPYRVVQTPYIARRETADFRKPTAMDDAAWRILRQDLEPVLWDAIQPVLSRREVPDALLLDIRRHVTRDVWLRILAEKPETLWRAPLPQIQAEVASSATEDKVTAAWDLLYRCIRLAAPTVQTLDETDHAVASAPWRAVRGELRLVQTTTDGRPAVEVWTDFRQMPRPAGGFLAARFTLPVDASRVRAITVPLRGDESYHHLTATLELAGATYRATRAIVLENYTWQEVTLQVQDEPRPHERDNILLRPTGRPSDVAGPREARVTLVLHRAPYAMAILRKFLRNYVDASTFVRFWLFFWNTVQVTALNIAAQLIACSLVAYAFARIRWPGRDAVFILLLSTMMLPAQVTMIPVFLIMRRLGLYDTLHPLWVGSLFGSAFFIFLLRQFLLSVPRDLEEAAKIDGCGFFGIYWRIMLPLVKPALAAIAIFQFMGAWNDFLGPLIYVSSERNVTLSLGLQLFQSMHTNEFGMLMAGATIMAAPVIAMFFFAQRYFIQGVTLTGMKA